MAKWLKEPLLHFLLLGALIFVVYGLLPEKGRSHDEIFISGGQQENLINTFARTWQRPPTAEEFKGLLDDFVRQEIATREGQAMGLDQDDIIIRRRLRQKLELLAEDVAALNAPSEEQLQLYLDEHADDFRLEPVISLRQIYFSPDRRSENTQHDAEALLQRISMDGPDAALAYPGDPLPLPMELRAVSASEIARMFGNDFARGLATIEPGKWSGPVKSGFGSHLVFVTDRKEGRAPSLEEVRSVVQRDWFSQRRNEAVEGMYARLAENYTIKVEPFSGESSENP